MGREGQHYMTERERYQLEAYLKAGKPKAWIARTMGFCRQTIYNEIRRGRYLHTYKWWDEWRYGAEIGERNHRYNQTAKGRPLKIGNHHDYARRLEALMLGRQPDGTMDRRKRFSPYAALMKTQKEGYPVTVCVATLYSYIDKGVFLNLTNKDLWVKWKRKKRGYRPVQRVAHPQLPSIENRPPEINDRSELGHWEMDLVVGRKKSRAALLTMTERKSRQEVIIKLPDKRSESIVAALRKLDTTKIRSITTDNGPEFLRFTELTQILHGGTIYYCHSYAAWEKGTNEVHNRMIRRWYPKGTDFKKISQAELSDLADWLNHYPRRELRGRSPEEAYHLAHALEGSSLRE